ncbi:MAG: hypothetical protein HRF43_13035, partial [Phycisphaerae bacterium]
DLVEVEVEGKGLTADEARRDALRTALERGGRTEIFSETQVENFQVLHDTIIARAQGLVTDYQVLKEGPLVGGGYSCRIKARVSKKVLAAAWAELQNLLDQVGRPKILVWIVERIDDKIQDESLLETKIEERLLKSGFDVVARRGVQAATQREMNAAAAAGKAEVLQALAKDAEAHIFIAGTANAHHAEIGSAYDVPLVFYNCDAEVKMYDTDTGKLLASKGLPNTRGGARGKTQFSPQAGRQALDNVSGPLIEALYAQVMEQWATALSAGSEITLEVENMTFGPANRLRKALQGVEKVRSVHLDLTGGLARYRIQARLTAQDLAERLSTGEFESLLEITDLKRGRIQARALGGPATQKTE